MQSLAWLALEQISDAYLFIYLHIYLFYLSFSKRKVRLDGRQGARSFLHSGRSCPARQWFGSPAPPVLLSPTEVIGQKSDLRFNPLLFHATTPL
jgi:hypothetical protein